MLNGECNFTLSNPIPSAQRDLERHDRYDPSNVYTEDGALVIELTKEPNSTSHGLGCKLSSALAFSLAIIDLVSLISQTSVV